MRARHCAAALAMALGLEVAGCSAPPVERYLRLDTVAVPLPAAVHPTLAGDVQVLPFGTHGLLSDRHVVYLATATGEASPAATLVWEDAPARGVARVVTRVLQAAGVAQAVLPPDEQGEADFWVDGSIDRFELVVTPGLPERAVVALDLTVFAGRARRPALIARYCRSVPSGTDPAHAFSEAVSAIAARLAGDIADHAGTINAAGSGGTPPAATIGQRQLGAGCDGNA